MAAELFENTERFQQNLVDFLQTEIERGVAFCRSAQFETYAGHSPQAQAALQSARNTLDTVRKFEERVGDEFRRLGVHEGAGQLDVLICSIETTLLETLFLPGAA